jgi:glycosyltransferase involved in cell wall biosynthesis
MALYTAERPVVMEGIVQHDNRNKAYADGQDSINVKDRDRSPHDRSVERHANKTNYSESKYSNGPFHPFRPEWHDNISVIKDDITDSKIGGATHEEVPYARAPRAAGQTKWNYWRLWNLSIEGITSFSIWPLQFASYFGFVIAFLAVAYGVFIILRTIFLGNPVPGYPSLLIIVLFLGGVQLLTLGVIGEYIGRIFNETKGRPLYLVSEALLTGKPQDKTRSIRSEPA